MPCYFYPTSVLGWDPTFASPIRFEPISQEIIDKIYLVNSRVCYYSPKRKKYRDIPFHSVLTEILLSMLEETTSSKLIDYKIVENLRRAVSRHFVEIGINDTGYIPRTSRKRFIPFVDPGLI